MNKKRKFLNKIKDEIREINKGLILAGIEPLTIKQVKIILKEAKKVNWRRYK